MNSMTGKLFHSAIGYLLRLLPGTAFGQTAPTSHRMILERAGDLVKALADNERIFYLDVNAVFLNPDGSINQNLMPDCLHPSPEGARRWAEAMEPLLSKLMGDLLGNLAPGNEKGGRDV